jgi:Cdc6-like AAA superfamily ATPase
MITHPRVFDDEWPPDELKHRDGPVDALSRAFDPATAGREAESVIIHGPSGVGKTALARHVLGRLERHADVATGLVDGHGTTTGAVLRKVIAAGPSSESPAQNATVDDLRRDLRERVDAPYVLVLDEAEGLPSTDALDHLLDVPGLSVVAIVHDEERWLARISDDARREIDVSIGLDRYHVDELTDILRDRATKGLAGDPVTDRQLERIADEVAGIARYGIQSLRAAARIADERDHWEIEDADIDDSFERARHRIRKLNLRSLPFHHHVIYAIVRDLGECSSRELHSRYDEIADAAYRGTDLQPIGKRDRRNKLEKLDAYDLIEREGQTQRVRDDSISAAVTLPAENRN